MADPAVSTVQGAFKKFEKDTARVPDDQNRDAKEVHPEIRKAVSGELSVARHFLSGSYGRKTQAKRLKDVDIIVVLEDEDGLYRASASDTLEQVREAVSSSDLVKSTRVSVRAVKAFLHDYEFHVDIVPALDPLLGDGLYLTRNIPDEGLDDWTLEDPESQLEAATSKNKDTGGVYVPATRIIKAWNQRYDTVKPLRSYHAEAILWHSMNVEVDFETAVLGFFDQAYAALAPGARTLVPGSSTRFVDDRLSDDERAEARERVEKARAAAHEAASLEDVGASLDAWTKVFGQSFPSPSTDPESVAASLRSGAAKAVGAGFNIGTSGGRSPIEGRSWSRY